MKIGIEIQMLFGGGIEVCAGIGGLAFPFDLLWVLTNDVGQV